MPSASSCFLHVFGFRKSYTGKVPGKIPENYKNYFATKEAGSQKGWLGGPQGQNAAPGRGPWGTRGGGGGVLPLLGLRHRPLALLILRA